MIILDKLWIITAIHWDYSLLDRIQANTVGNPGTPVHTGLVVGSGSFV